MPNFYDLLKAKSIQENQDFYTTLLARNLKRRTYRKIEFMGVAPFSISAKEDSLLSYILYGRGPIQKWEPSPLPMYGDNLINNAKIEKGSAVTNFTYTNTSISYGSLTSGTTLNSEEIKTDTNTYAYQYLGDVSKVTLSVKCYNSNHEFIGDANTLFSDTGKAVVTTLNNTQYIRLVIANNVQGLVTINNLMMNKGGQVKPFEIYQNVPETGPCELQGVGYNNISIKVNGQTDGIIVLDAPLFLGDYVSKNEQSILHREWGVYQFTGQEHHIGKNVQDETDYMFCISLKEFDIPKPTYSKEIYCSHLPTKEHLPADDTIGILSSEKYNEVFVNFGPDIMEKYGNTPQGVKQFMQEQYEAGTPVTIVYPLETPIENEIILPNINLETGLNYIDTDTEIKPQINIKYTNVRKLNYVGTTDEKALLTSDEKIVILRR